jgi:hypothetical protein
VQARERGHEVTGRSGDGSCDGECDGGSDGGCDDGAAGACGTCGACGGDGGGPERRSGLAIKRLAIKRRLVSRRGWGGGVAVAEVRERRRTALGRWKSCASSCIGLM